MSAIPIDYSHHYKYIVKGSRHFFESPQASVIIFLDIYIRTLLGMIRNDDSNLRLSLSRYRVQNLTYRMPLFVDFSVHWNACMIP